MFFVLLERLDFWTTQHLKANVHTQEIEKLLRSEPSASFVDMRALFSLGGPTVAVAGHAFGLLTWRRYAKFCGRCGHKTQVQEAGIKVVCPTCRVSACPCMIPQSHKQIREGMRPQLTVATAWCALFGGWVIRLHTIHAWIRWPLPPFCRPTATACCWVGRLLFPRTRTRLYQALLISASLWRKRCDVRSGKKAA